MGGEWTEDIMGREADRGHYGQSTMGEERGTEDIYRRRGGQRTLCEVRGSDDTMGGEGDTETERGEATEYMGGEEVGGGASG